MGITHEAYDMAQTNLDLNIYLETMFTEFLDSDRIHDDFVRANLSAASCMSFTNVKIL